MCGGISPVPGTGSPARAGPSAVPLSKRRLRLHTPQPARARRPHTSALPSVPPSRGISHSSSPAPASLGRSAPRPAARDAPPTPAPRRLAHRPAARDAPPATPQRERLHPPPHGAGSTLRRRREAHRAVAGGASTFYPRSRISSAAIAAFWPPMPLTAPPRRAEDPQIKMRRCSVSTPHRSAAPS